MKKITNHELLTITKGDGGFCEGFALIEGIAAVGIAANWWNPPGWGAGMIAAGITAYCIVKEL